MNALVHHDDGNDGFERPDRSGRPRRYLKWSAEKGWHDNDGLSPPKQMMAMGAKKGYRRWQGSKPEYKWAKPLPDLDELNAAIPEEEWETDLTGKKRKPWNWLYSIILFDLVSGATYAFDSETAGAGINFDQLQESVDVMRALRGAKVLPLVSLEQRPMRTNFGMKSRPHLQIIDWRMPGGGGGGDGDQLPEPRTPQLRGPITPTAAPASASTVAGETLKATAPVRPVTTAEYIRDEMPPWA